MKLNELQKFSVMLAIFPLIPAFILHKHNMDDIAVIIMQLFIILSIICLTSNKFASCLKKHLTKMGELFGRIFSAITLFFVYILVVLPMGILIKLVKRDRLKLKKQKRKTYWCEYKKINTDYEYQF